jgi:hypothetical protein
MPRREGLERVLIVGQEGQRPYVSQWYDQYIQKLRNIYSLRKMKPHGLSDVLEGLGIGGLQGEKSVAESRWRCGRWEMA